jgi:sigma-B regulation protein RsbU (phosphoserine phosphatase)
VTSTPAGDPRLRGVHAVTDTTLAHLDVEALISALLGRIRDELSVDTVTVLLLDPHGHDLVAAASVGLEDEVTQGVRLPVGGGFAGKVAATRAPVQLAQVDRSSVLNPLLIEHGIQSILGVPMIAAGELVGVLHVGSLTPRFFTETEINLLQVAAERMALATQSRLVALDRAATVALQRSLLPAPHISVDGLRVAARYVPGTREGVGGDWYDVFALPDGRVGVVIGDVVGHGLRAAVVMGRIRSALRAYALDWADPAEVLTRLDRKITIFEPGAMATALYAVVEPGRTTMKLSTAGHPAPVFAPADGPPRILDVRSDLPLGVDYHAARHTVEVPLPVGALLLCYTDGLVERRDEPISDGLERLRLQVKAGPAEEACARVMSAMIGTEQVSDDVAVLAIARTSI